MDKYYVLVAGNGETSRANLEALMEDHYYANGSDGTFVLSFDIKPSKTQEFAAQFAKEKNKNIIMFSSQAADFSAFPNASFQLSSNPLHDAVKMMSGEKSSAFILWDDEDQASANALAICKESDIPCFDLSDGLTPLTASKGLKEVKEPTFPEKEIVSKEEDEAEEEDGTEEEESEEDEDFEDEETDDAEEEALDNLYFGVQEIARIFAAAFVEEIEARKKGKEEPK